VTKHVDRAGLCVWGSCKSALSGEGAKNAQAGEVRRQTPAQSGVFILPLLRGRKMQWVPISHIERSLDERKLLRFLWY
jgi:hypothetical protein